MQSKWGPRLFWVVVFGIAALGMYVLFSEPGNELAPTGYVSPLASMVTINPRLAGCELQLGVQDRASTQWKGNFKIAKGKILQCYVAEGNPASTTAGTRFDCTSDFNNDRRQPAVLHLVYLAEPEDTLTITIGTETHTVNLADLSKQPQTLFNGNAILRSEVPQQRYDNDSVTDDLLPVVTHDSKGQAYLLYLNVEHSKGLEVNNLLTGSFESLESPIINVGLRLSLFQDGAWQFSEPVTTGKLDSCLHPALAVDAKGRIYVAWLQKNLEGWDIYYTSREPGGSWSKPARLTKKSGAHQQLIAGADAKGRIWLAWQTWQESYYDIYAAVLNDDKHPLRVPGTVAERAQQMDGRWFPAMAADQLGNMYIAWSVFNQGHFDIEVMKMTEAAAKGKSWVLQAGALDALRPALKCDGDNQLWLAYEESEPVTNFGDAHLPGSQIRVRLLKQDGSLLDWPLIPGPTDLPATPRVDKATTPLPARCTQAHLLLSQEGVPIVTFQSQQRLFSSRWQDQGWSAPKVLTDWSPLVQTNAPTIYQAGHVIGIHETIDLQGRVRLLLAASTEPTASMTMPKQSPGTLPKPVSTWKPFSELARQFRKRTDDQVLNKRYLLRGLVLTPHGVATLGHDPWCLSALALEQSYYDWIMIPQDPQAPISLQWMNGQRSHAINQGTDRNFLLGYYRPMLGQREPLLHIDTKKDEWPLPALPALDRYRKASEKETRIGVTEAIDRAMITQFINLRQRLGFLLTDNWRMLPVLTKPGEADAFRTTMERTMVPLWHPEATPDQSGQPGLRVVAMANGKSYDQLVDALRDRHFYVATDDIYLLVHCEKHLPGDVFQSYFKPTISVLAQGTGKLSAVEIWLDNKLVKKEVPPGQASILEYTYSEPDRQWHSYTVRAVQENGTEAIVQPFWIRYIP